MYVLKKLKNMFQLSSESDEVKDFAKSLFQKKNTKFIALIKEKEEVMKNDQNRDIQEKLKKWRLKDRKLEFTEKI